jgi:hypothetical protein
MNSDITEQYLNGIYDNFQREQLKLMNEMKNNSNDNIKEKDITKQITFINAINMNIMRLRNLRKSMADKINM